MSDMKFDMPWRIHWRPGSQVSPAVVDAIRVTKPLAVTVHLERVEQLEAASLPWEGCALVVILDGWVEQNGPLPDISADRWEFPVSDPGDMSVLVEREFLGVDPARAALRWYPVRGEFADLVPLLELAAEHGCSVTLPNRPAGVITSEDVLAFPDPSELDSALVKEIKTAAAPFEPGRIRVHDFILTRVLEIGGTELSGCEAANAVAYIDDGGTVYPCETLMVAMGNLQREDLYSIWNSPVRERIRRDVRKMPGVCLECPELAMCRGGCRGAVYHLKGHYGDVDPLCREG
jgi:GeoRSP system SPASM domain protein